MDVWIVEHTSIETGSRIEGFDVKFEIYTDESKALIRAWKLAITHIDAKIKYNQKGKYISKSSGGYDDWPDHSISV